MLRGSGIAGYRRLLKLGREMAGLYQFQQALLGRREKHIIRFDLRIPPPLFEFGEEPFSVVLVVWRADMVRARTEALHILPQIGWIRNGAELAFPIALRMVRLR